MKNGTSLTWRAAQAWLAGYSDGLEGNPNATRAYWAPDFAEDYDRGHDHGTAKREVK
jgi:hypothetical protein